VFFLLSKILDLAIAPLCWAIALVVVALFVRTARRRAVLLLLAALDLTVLASPPVANALVRAMELPAEQSYRPDVTYDTVVLLGGMVEDNMYGSEDPRAVGSFNQNIERLLATYDLLRQNKAKTAILSGGPTEGGAIEANVLANQLVAWGIDRSRLLLETHSLNTHDNAVASAAIIRQEGFHTILVVTSAFHAPRAHGCFRAVGLDVDMLPVDFHGYDPALGKHSIAPRAFAFEQSTAMIREAVGRLVYRLHGYSI
jgi:uncharacterized SAM-binding protein YcdF (DUF218 family)